MQAFVIVMALLVVIGTLVDIIHKKNVKYFFENAKKAKKSAKKTLTAGEKTAVVVTCCRCVALRRMSDSNYLFAEKNCLCVIIKIKII